MPNFFEPRDQYEPKRLAEKKHAKKPLIAAGVTLAVLVLAFAGISSWGLYAYDRVYPGVSAGGIGVSGFSREELESRLKQENGNLYKGKSIKITVRKTEYEISAQDVGAGINAEKAAEAVYSYGRTGGYFRRLGEVVNAAANGVSVGILSLDEKALRGKADQIADDFLRKSRASDYEIVDDTLILYLANKHAVLEPETVYNALLDRFKKADFSALTITPEYEKIEEPDVDSLYGEIVQKPQNARLDLEKDPTGNTILPEKSGIDVNLGELKRLIENRGDKTEIEIPITVTQPEITADELREVLFRDVLSSVNTNLNPSLVNRTGNVRLAAQHVNGTILNPGDVFSYNAAVGMRTKERGFKDAKVFENGEIVDGVGGGICQVSSTAYMAALRADLSVKERRSHQFTVSYTPLGQDATVVYGSTDLKFVNSTPYPIKIEAYQKGSGVTVTLRGTKTENKEIKLYTTVLEKTPYQSRTVVDPTLKPGERVVESEGHTGYKTVTYRVVVKDGKEVSRTVENKSTYKKLDYVIRLGQKHSSLSSGTSADNGPSGAGGETAGNNKPKDPLITDADPVSGPDQNIPGETGEDVSPDQENPEPVL